MAEIVNLRSMRKRAERREKEDAAAANRLAHGRPKSERQAEKARTAKSQRDLDAHRRERDEP